MYKTIMRIIDTAADIIVGIIAIVIVLIIFSSPYWIIKGIIWINNNTPECTTHFKYVDTDNNYGEASMCGEVWGNIYCGESNTAVLVKSFEAIEVCK